MVDEHNAAITFLPDRPQQHVKTADTVVRWTPEDPGSLVEFKTADKPSQSAVERCIRTGSKKFAPGEDGAVVIDGRPTALTEEMAAKAWGTRSRAGGTLAAKVHFILHDGRWFTITADGTRTGGIDV